MAEGSLRDLLKRVTDEAQRLGPAPAEARSSASGPDSPERSVVMSPDAVPGLMTGIEEALGRHARGSEERRQAQIASEMDALRLDQQQFANTLDASVAARFELLRQEQQELVRTIEAAVASQLQVLRGEQAQLVKSIDAALAVQLEGLRRGQERVGEAAGATISGQLETLRQEQQQLVRSTDTALRELLGGLLSLRDRMAVVETMGKKQGERLELAVRRPTGVDPQRSRNIREQKEPSLAQQWTVGVLAAGFVVLAVAVGGVAAIQIDEFRELVTQLILLFGDAPRSGVQGLL